MLGNVVRNFDASVMSFLLIFFRLGVPVVIFRFQSRLHVQGSHLVLRRQLALLNIELGWQILEPPYFVFFDHQLIIIFGQLLYLFWERFLSPKTSAQGLMLTLWLGNTTGGSGNRSLWYWKYFFFSFILFLYPSFSFFFSPCSSLTYFSFWFSSYTLSF